MKIQFIDIKTGKTFDAPPSNSGVCSLWFDGGQSTNLIYSKQICIVSDVSQLTFKLPENNGIFNLINLPNSSSRTSTFYGVKYYNYDELISKSSQIFSVGEPYENYYLHNIFISASSEKTGQYIEDLVIFGLGETASYSIGADFYDEDETLLINLANQGQEIPQSIQRAIYDKNVHEELNDNVLLNRKWKELLLNSISTFISKGSYKSLVDSLKWFEYGDKLNVEEYWKFMIAGKQFLNSENIEKLLTTSYQTLFSNLAKTTYIGVSCPLESIRRDEDGVIIKDSEMNPDLEGVIFKWTNEEMAIKLSLLGNFYSTYFMPIHLDLIHSTIEDIAFPQTIKIQKFGLSDRHDTINRLTSFDCNVKSGQKFEITNISSQVGPNTLFGHKYSGEQEYSNIYSIGVDKLYEGSLGTNEDDIKTFYSQLTNTPGVIIPFECTLISDIDDSIQREIISFTNNLDENVIYTDHSVVDFLLDSDTGLYKAIIKFNLIYFKPRDKYEVSLQFHAISGLMYTKKIQFSVLDTSRITLKIFKLSPKKEQDVSLTDFDYSSLLNDGVVGDPYIQYIPTHSKYVSKNHYLAIVGDVSYNTYLKTNYYCYVKQTVIVEGDPDIRYDKYTICTSKEIGFVPDYNNIPSTYVILRDDYVFMPQFYKLTEICNDIKSISDATISNYELCCIKPYWVFGDGSELELKYTLPDDSNGWRFINKSILKTYSFPVIQNPLLVSDENYGLTNGVYDIILHCKLAEANRTIIRNRALLVRDDNISKISGSIPAGMEINEHNIDLLLNQGILARIFTTMYSPYGSYSNPVEAKNSYFFFAMLAEYFTGPDELHIDSSYKITDSTGIFEYNKTSWATGLFNYAGHQYRYLKIPYSDSLIVPAGIIINISKQYDPGEITETYKLSGSIPSDTSINEINIKSLISSGKLTKILSVNNSPCGTYSNEIDVKDSYYLFACPAEHFKTGSEYNINDYYKITASTSDVFEYNPSSWMTGVFELDGVQYRYLRLPLNESLTVGAGELIKIEEKE